MKKHEDCEKECKCQQYSYPCTDECELIQREEYENWMRNMSREERLGWMKARDQEVD